MQYTAAQSQSVAIIGASGYVGVELTRLVQQHPALSLLGCYVSEHSSDAGSLLSDLHPQYAHLVKLSLQGLSSQKKELIKSSADTVFLCTDHGVSVELAPEFLAAGLKVIDLSGGFRLNATEDYPSFYGFEHQQDSWLQQAVYGLAEWYPQEIVAAQLVAVPGCYPTAALMALLPVKQAGLLSCNKIIINAVSGVTGAGRKAALTSHGAELSLQAYGLFEHRHTPEIAQQLQHEVLFTPHLAQFPRGILATVYAELNDNVSDTDLDKAYQCYADKPLVRFEKQARPAIKNVVEQPFVDIGWHRQGTQLIAFSAIDNLLKGAASQAIQCVNLQLGLAAEEGLV
ncbi:MULTISPECIES: N-acetyl-gamma-glutamyl-phosphate reductase [unclassified Idiomarina]|uniref:N-acetyl-gamma-glutamyl-phosphate reductase n=1 Tax=unclassified Idiomarina TaxID=2614829 RepID=UPI00257D457D|nr:MULTISPECIES: N-acetyl-gamma-glutamyl-phosphate reductase [unclassified Idiomarina]|tara:strand:- start:10623 stop:11648 length:1026 start_codon:yes stop_codon:yes gene_type:complete